MKKLNSILILLFFAAVILEGFNIYLSNRVSSESFQATELREQISMIDEQNQNVRSEILDYTSFENIASRAATLGFVEGRNSISLDSPVEVASR